MAPTLNLPWRERSLVKIDWLKVPDCGAGILPSWNMFSDHQYWTLRGSWRRTRIDWGREGTGQGIHPKIKTQNFQGWSATPNLKYGFCSSHCLLVGLCPSKSCPSAKVQLVPWPGCGICKGSCELDLPTNWGLEKPVRYWSPVEMWEGFGQRNPDSVYGFTPQTEGHTDLAVSHACNGAEETRLPCGAASAEPGRA